MATRKKTPIKTPEAIRAAQDAVIETKPEPVVEPIKEEIPKVVDFSLVQQVLGANQLKSGETVDDKLTIIALKFYQRINKLPITGKLDSATLKDMGLN